MLLRATVTGNDPVRSSAASTAGSYPPIRAYRRENRRWDRERNASAAAILTDGTDATGRWLVQAFGRDDIDAALLLIPTRGFPVPPALWTRTLDVIREQLGTGDYLRRYCSDDALGGTEGAFLMCSFWLVDALLFAGRHDEARGLYERLLSRANDVGLYAEEIRAADDTFLGSFPQALTHLAVIHSGIVFQLLNEKGPAARLGTPADRARRLVGATHGLRGIWAAFRKSGRVGRLRSSRASIAPNWRAST